MTVGKQYHQGTACLLLEPESEGTVGQESTHREGLVDNRLWIQGCTVEVLGQ